MNTIQRCSLSILLIALGSSGCQPTPDIDSPGKSQQAQLEVGGPIALPEPDEPGLFSGEYLLSLPGGKLILACGKISLRSQDSGASWQTGPGLLYAKATAGGTEPSGRLLRLADESLIALAGRAQKGAKPGLFSGRWARFASLEELTSASGDSWQETSLKVERWKALTADNDTEVTELQVTGPMLELEDGTLLAATYGNFQGDTVPMVGFVANKGQKWFKYRTYLLESRDGGESWQYLSTIAYDGDTGQESFCEPAMVDLGSGELLAIMRTGRFAPLHQARSLDGGKTWGKPESSHILGLAPQMVLLENGALVCSFGWRPMKVAYGLAMTDEEGPYPAAARDYEKRYRDDVGIEDPSAEAGDYVMVSYDKGKTWSQRRRIADPLTIGYTLLAATGPDSCLVISRRIQIPGESAESVAQKWRDEWPEWNDKSHVALEARQIRVGSPPAGS